MYFYITAYTITLEAGRIMPSEPNLDDGRSPFLLFPPLSSIGTCIRTRHTHTQTPNLLPPPTLLHRLLGIQSDHFFSLRAHQSYVAFIPVQKNKKKPCFSFIMYLSLFLPSFPCYFIPSSLLSFSIHNGPLCIIRKTR